MTVECWVPGMVRKIYNITHERRDLRDYVDGEVLGEEIGEDTFLQ